MTSSRKDLTAATQALRGAPPGGTVTVWRFQQGRYVRETVRVLGFTANRERCQVMNPLTGHTRWVPSTKPCNV